MTGGLAGGEVLAINFMQIGCVQQSQGITSANPAFIVTARHLAKNLVFFLTKFQMSAIQHAGWCLNVARFNGSNMTPVK